MVTAVSCYSLHAEMAGLLIQKCCPREYLKVSNSLLYMFDHFTTEGVWFTEDIVKANKASKRCRPDQRVLIEELDSYFLSRRIKKLFVTSEAQSESCTYKNDARRKVYPCEFKLLSIRLAIRQWLNWCVHHQPPRRGSNMQRERKSYC